jgi:hypothetical protein
MPLLYPAFGHSMTDGSGCSQGRRGPGEPAATGMPMT